jgi:hypothetical protein
MVVTSYRPGHIKNSVVSEVAAGIHLRKQEFEDEACCYSDASTQVGTREWHKRVLKVSVHEVNRLTRNVYIPALAMVYGQFLLSCVMSTN